MSDVAVSVPAVEAKPRRLADIRALYHSLHRLDPATRHDVTKAIARSIVRGEDVCALVRIINDGDAAVIREKGGSLPPDLEEMQKAADDQVEAFGGRTESLWTMSIDAAEGCEHLPLTMEPQEAYPLVDWILHLQASDPKAFGKLPRMSFSAMWQAQERWHAALAKRKTEAAAADLASCPVLHRYDDGWAWVWVRTDAERDAEGDAMGHCVGQGAYDKLGRGGAIISLRDPAGRPHVTVQIAGVRRVQAQGRANRPPAEKYAARIADVTVRVGAAVTRHGEPMWMDEAEAMEIVAEHVARNVRKTGGSLRVSMFPINPEAGRGLVGRIVGGF